MTAPKKAAKPRGRPPIYTRQLAEEIVKRLSDGEPLAVICRDDHMPDPSTVWDWRAKDKDFFQAIARARMVGHDNIAANTRKVARGEDGFSSGDVQRDKLIIETDLKLLAKWDPRYNEKLALVGGSDDDAPIRMAPDLGSLSAEQREVVREMANHLLQRRAQALGDQREGD